MDNRDLLISVLGSLMLGTVIVLSGMGEGRIDVYVSLFTVQYFMVSALIRVRKRPFDFVGLTLFSVFCWIIAKKVAGILFVG